jgi:uncharacterized protein
MALYELVHLFLIAAPLHTAESICAAPRPDEKTNIQTALSRIQINNTELVVELAATEETRAQGLMNRTTLTEGMGMLFIFEKSQNLFFWMKNTTIPLSIGFFDENHSLINIENMDPPKNDDLLLYKSKKPARYALEVPQGWFERHQIRPPMKFEKVSAP